MFPTDAELEELGLVPLPSDVQTILRDESAPPRLVAHLALVHDIAVRLLRRLREAWPALEVDAAAVAFGAATHDVGKARHVDELSEPGKLHEVEGERLLLARGVPASMARFARTHGARDLTGLALEDVLVVVADTAWKGKRSRELDDAVALAVAGATGAAAWEVFMQLDEVLSALGADADARLAWQGRFPVSAG